MTAGWSHAAVVTQNAGSIDEASQGTVAIISSRGNIEYIQLYRHTVDIHSHVAVKSLIPPWVYACRLLPGPNHGTTGPLHEAS